MRMEDHHGPPLSSWNHIHFVLSLMEGIMKTYLVTVTRVFTEEVEAESPDEAEEIVRNMDWFDIQYDVDIGVVEE